MNPPSELTFHTLFDKNTHTLCFKVKIDQQIQTITYLYTQIHKHIHKYIYTRHRYTNKEKTNGIIIKNMR